MTDETEAAKTELQIKDKDDFAEWLGKPQLSITCLALASRAALRALPFINYNISAGFFSNDYPRELAPCMFRATSLAWFKAKYRGKIQSVEAILQETYDYSSAEASNSSQPTSRLIWAAAEAVKLANDYHSNPLIHEIENISSTSDLSNIITDRWLGSEIHKETYSSVENAVSGILLILFPKGTGFFQVSNRVYSPPHTSKTVVMGDAVIEGSETYVIRKEAVEKAIWRAIEDDVRLIASGASARQLAASPLWHGSPLPFISYTWYIFANSLPDSDGWRVWKDWYEDRLNGKTHSEARELIYATVPVEEWDKGPAAANAWIARRLDELKNNPPDSLADSFEKLIAQDPHGAPFEIVEGKARIASSLDENDAKVAENSQTIQIHERVKIRANSARERVRRLANQPGFESIAATVEEFYNYISGDTLSVAANISTVWELSVAIGSFIERDDEIRAGRGGMVSEMDADARETLDQLVIASAPFVRRFPTARQNDDDVRLFKQSRESFKPAKQIFEQAIKDNLIEESSKAVIAAALNSAEISSGIQSEKSRSWIANTARNLTRSLFNFVVASGVSFGACFGAAFTGKAIEDFYDHSQSGPLIREFLLEKEDDIIHLFSDLPSDVRATIRETYRRLKKI